MTYRVEFTPDAALTFHQLPREAQDAFFARASELSEAPWDGAGVVPPGFDSSVRQALFGTAGIVQVRVNEATEVLRFTRLVWAASGARGGTMPRDRPEWAG